MRNLLLILGVLFTSLVYSQEVRNDDDEIIENEYNLFYIDTIKKGDKISQTRKMIEYIPDSSFFNSRNMTKWDTIALLSYVGKKVVDSLNNVRVSLGLNKINEEFDFDFNELSIFEYVGKKKTPLMVTDVYYDIVNCECYGSIVEELLSYEDIKKKILSKRNKKLKVTVLYDKKTEDYVYYIMVKRFITTTYDIN
jgi:hypothetical protein